MLSALVFLDYLCEYSSLHNVAVLLGITKKFNMRIFTAKERHENKKIKKNLLGYSDD